VFLNPFAIGQLDKSNNITDDFSYRTPVISILQTFSFMKTIMQKAKENDGHAGFLS